MSRINPPASRLLLIGVAAVAGALTTLAVLSAPASAAHTGPAPSSSSQPTPQDGGVGDWNGAR